MVSFIPQTGKIHSGDPRIRLTYCHSDTPVLEDIIMSNEQNSLLGCMKCRQTRGCVCVMCPKTADPLPGPEMEGVPKSTRMIGINR